VAVVAEAKPKKAAWSRKDSIVDLFLREGGVRRHIARISRPVELFHAAFADCKLANMKDLTDSMPTYFHGQR